MIPTTRSAISLAESGHHLVATSALVVLFWAFAAALVGTAHLRIDRTFPLGSAAVEIGLLVGVAFCYMRFVAPAATVDHALLVGVVWLLLTIIAEMAIASRVHHGWFALLGTPSRPMLRNAFLFVWIFAPALFAEREAIR
jgi:hypothetical protein